MQCYFTIHGARLYFVFLTEEGLTVTESKRFVFRLFQNWLGSKYPAVGVYNNFF